MKNDPFRQKNIEDHWLSVSDMMSGLMVIFLFISVAYMISVIKEKEKIKIEKDAISEIAITYNKTQGRLIKNLNNEFKDDLKKWDAEIDPKKLSIKFNSPEVFFDQGDFKIKQKFSDILSDFFPRFIRILMDSKFKNEIEEIRIEGHTSSEWQEKITGDIAYIKNMQLSQDRTREVLAYILSLNAEIITNNKRWLMKKLTANGLSSSRIQFNMSGKEDKSKSRRVEFRVKTKAEEKIFKIIKKAG